MFNKIFDSENLRGDTLNLVEPFFLFKLASYTHYSSTDNSTSQFISTCIWQHNYFICFTQFHYLPKVIYPASRSFCLAHIGL